MPNTELLRLTKEATSAFNAYKSALRQKGHKISGEINLAELTGLSGWEEQLRRDWLISVSKCENEAGFPSQTALPGMAEPRTMPNPLDLHLNHAYRLIESGVDYLFRHYNAEDDLYSFWHQDGGIRGGTTWVKEAFDLANAPEFDSTIPTEDPALTAAIEYDEEDGVKYVVKRVGPERFAELLAVDSSLGLRMKSPTAKSIEILADQSYVVTRVATWEDAETQIYLTPCAPAAKDEKGEGFFKCGKDRWKIQGEPIIIRLAAVAEVVDQADPGSMAQSDPLEFLKRLQERGFLPEGEAIELAPRSFEALKMQIAPDLDPEVISIYIPTMDMSAVLRPEGIQIDGWEEPESEVAEAPEIAVNNGAHVVGDTPAEDTPIEKPKRGKTRKEAPAEAAPAEAIPGENRIIPHAAAYASVRQWDVTFEDTADGIPISVAVKFMAEPGFDLFCIQWLEMPTDSYEPVAWLCDANTVKGTKQSIGEYAKALCVATLELRLSE